MHSAGYVPAHRSGKRGVVAGSDGSGSAVLGDTAQAGSAPRSGRGIDVRGIGCSGNTEPHLYPGTALSRAWLGLSAVLQVSIRFGSESGNLAVFSVSRSNFIVSDSGCVSAMTLENGAMQDRFFVCSLADSRGRNAPPPIGGQGPGIPHLGSG